MRGIIEALPEGFPAWAREEVLGHYSERVRAYHVMRHVEYMWTAHVANGGHPDDLGTLYAILYHDVVYDPLRKDNEEASWVMFEGHAPYLPGADEEVVTSVREMIRASALHPISVNLPDAAARIRWFCDLDLLSLGCEFDLFQSIGRRIRTEFSHVPDDAFVLGRSAFFRSILAAPRIYATDHFRDRCEGKARDNIARALTLLAEHGLDREPESMALT